MKRVAVALLLLLAGCAGSLPAGTETPTRERTATVTHVVDGDTIDVRFADGSTDTVRLLGVDAPETRGDVTPSEFGLPDTEAVRDCLRTAADDATAFAQARLAGREVVVTTDPTADRRGGYGRLLAYVRAPGADESFNRALLAAGHARVYVTGFSRLSAFRDAAEAAQAADRGLWACD
ncbi:MAG: thermonuclease family protein [Halobacteriaceae archaeon]